MTDNPASVRVTIHEEVRDPIDNQPCMQDVVISDFFHTLLVHFDTEGAMTLRRVATTEVTYMHLSADMATALSTAHLTWMQQIEAWQELEAFAKAQREAEAMTASPKPECCECDKPGHAWIGEKLYCKDHLPVGMKWPGEMAEAAGPTQDEQATREAAENPHDNFWAFEGPYDRETIEKHSKCSEHCPVQRWVAHGGHVLFESEQREAAEQVVDLDPQRCVAVGCKEPALLRIGEFWYCAEHSKEPIPF